MSSCSVVSAKLRRGAFEERFGERVRNFPLLSKEWVFETFFPRPSKYLWHGFFRRR
jgi:hypothetical protein